MNIADLSAPDFRVFQLSSGLYFHIPFCKSRCNYCHFISREYERSEAIRYGKAVLREIESSAAAGAGMAVDSIYFGGGTPSIVPAKHIVDILRACRRKYRVSEECEISIETNPGTVSDGKIAAYRESGITRISMGAQSFSSLELAAVGRIHSPEMILDSLNRLKTGGFKNINLDLMLGLPYQTGESWKATLDVIPGLEIAHISVYMLDLNEGCPLQTMVREGKLIIPQDDLISDLYLETIDFLSSCGYEHYEISNFALPGYRCCHNIKYWKRKPVYGFGLGSHSFDGKMRWSNWAGMEDYLTAVESGKSPVEWRNPIDKERALQETLFLGLRMSEGVDCSLLKNLFGARRLSAYENAMQEWLRIGLIENNGRVLRLTAAGMLVSNEIFQQFV